MKKLLVAFLTVVVVVTSILLATNDTQMPKGWFGAGSKPSEYEMGIDKTVFQSGNSSAYLKSKEPKGNDFGTIMQYINAENYIGKRLRFSGFIKSYAVEGWSGMWMRIDGETGQQLGFDNMQGRAVKGTTDWKKYEIVLDIPTGSKGLAYGVLLSGKGKVWFDNLRIEKVEKTIAVTNMIKEIFYPKEPMNLDLEE